MEKAVDIGSKHPFRSACKSVYGKGKRKSGRGYHVFKRFCFLFSIMEIKTKPLGEEYENIVKSVECGNLFSQCFGYGGSKSLTDDDYQNRAPIKIFELDKELEGPFFGTDAQYAEGVLIGSVIGGEFSTPEGFRNPMFGGIFLRHTNNGKTEVCIKVKEAEPIDGKICYNISLESIEPFRLEEIEKDKRFKVMKVEANSEGKYAFPLVTHLSDKQMKYFGIEKKTVYKFERSRFTSD